MEKEITVILGSPDETLRAELKRAIGEKDRFRVVGEAASMGEVGPVRERVFPDIAILDVAFWRVAETMARAGQTKVIILADVPKEELWRMCLHAGISDLLPRNVTREQLIASLEAVGEPERKNGKLPGKTVAIFSTKGGVGKTTLAVNLGTALGTRLGERMAVWDLDLEFGNAAAFFGLKPKTTVADLAGRATRDGREEVPPWEMVERLFSRPGGYPVDLLPPPATPEMAEVVENALSGGLTGQLLAEMRKRYSFTLVDLPSNFRETTLAALDAADTILVITGPDIPSLYNTAKGLDVLLNRLGYGREKVRLCLNRSDAAMTLSQEDIAKALNHPVSFTIPSDGVMAVTSANTGQPFMRRRNRGYLAEAIGNMADQLAGIGSRPQEKARPKVLWMF